MEIIEPKQRRTPAAISRRQCSIKYTVRIPISSENLRVCQKTLCDITGVTARKIQCLADKIKQGATDLSDLRGKHLNRTHSIPNDVKELVREHIRSFPRQESHYSRNTSSKECLAADLNLKIMYQMFTSKHPEVKASDYLYRQIFHDEFNLRFGTPRSDTCATCDKNFVKLCAAETQEEYDRLYLESEVHHEKAESAYHKLKEDTNLAKANSNVHVLCVDLQQVLFCPVLTHSNVFYQRQLSTYNCAIHNGGTNEVSMSVWDETTAKRGANEIASVILHYVTERFNPLTPDQERRLIVWSDRCVGQNNNWKIISLYHLLIVSHYFTQIDQKFLVSGHSFLPCDRDFALVEKRKATAQVYLPFHWVEVIANARPSKPFEVVHMQQEYFRDIGPAEQTIKKDPELKITTAAWLQFSSDDPMSLKLRKCHDVLLPWAVYSLQKSKRTRNKTVNHISHDNLPRLYHGPIPITKEKKHDLIAMSSFLPLGHGYSEFYHGLITE